MPMFWVKSLSEVPSNPCVQNNSKAIFKAVAWSNLTGLPLPLIIAKVVIKFWIHEMQCMNNIPIGKNIKIPFILLGLSNFVPISKLIVMMSQFINYS